MLTRQSLRCCVLGGAIIVGFFASVKTSAWAQTDAVQIAKGEKVYEDKKCAACHAIKGKGGKVGPELNAVGAKRDGEWLRTFIKTPKTMNPQSKMLPFKGSEEELEALVVYLGALK